MTQLLRTDRRVRSELHASAGAIEWVVAGYGLTSAVFLITAARLGDRIGRRRAFSLGLGLFTLASAACGLAAGPEVLVGARLVQGVGGALIMPNVLAIIGAAYAGAERGRALGAPARSRSAWSRSSPSGAARRRSSSCSPSTCSGAAGSARWAPACCSPCSRCSSPRSC